MLAPMALALLIAAALGAARQAATGPAVLLPPGAARDAVAAIRADIAPAELAGPEWPAWDDPAWDGHAPWARWSELVLEEAGASRPDAGRRAALALAAALQERPLDAWEHFAGTAAQPAVAAALLPRLFPGAPADAPKGRGGRPGALPDGVLLRPILPPLDLESPYGRPRIREMHFEGLAIGKAVCDVKLAVEADGVELTFTHRSGGAARVRVVLPVPIEEEVRALYVAWEQVHDPPPVIELELAPGTEDEPGEASVWGRFYPRTLAWPAPSELALPRQLARGGFALEVDPGDPLAPRLARAAEALALVLGVPGRVQARGTVPAADAGVAPQVFAFPAGEPEALRQARLFFLLSAAERFLLRAR